MGKLFFIFLALGGFVFYSCQYQAEQNLKSDKSTNEAIEKVEVKTTEKTDSTVHVSVKTEKEETVDTSTKSIPVAHFKDMHSFMNSYCFSCHGEKKQKGKLRLDNLEFNEDTMLVWQDVVDQLTTGDMPPEDEKNA